MDLGIRLIDIIFPMFGFLFPFWPFFVLVPILSKGRVLAKMLVMWAAFLVVRIILVYSPLLTIDFFIREPVNTIVFLIAGGIIILTIVIRRMRKTT